MSEGEEPPSEFRLFRRGVNASEKGDFLFDEVSAETVMAAYNAQGVDVHIDLEHLALDPESNSFDPDARGWAKLEVRNGELWAVDVRWTNDGTRRLTEKLQRYISPAFLVDENRRITKILNIALTGLPATHQTAALVAANQLEKLSMSPDMVKRALEAIKTGDLEGAQAVLEEMLVAQASGEEAPEEESAPEAETPEESGDALASVAEEPVPDEEKEAMRSALSTFCALTGRKSADEALSQVQTWSKRFAELQEREVAVELAARRDLIADLVKLGAELPATAWAGDAKDRVPCQRLAAEAIDDLRARVTVLRAAKPTTVVRPPVGKAETVTLSDRELRAIKQAGITPEEYVKRKASAVRRTV